PAVHPRQRHRGRCDGRPGHRRADRSGAAASGVKIARTCGFAAPRRTPMAGFTPERRVADHPSLIPPTGDRRRKPRIACDPAREEAYWRESYRREPYFERGYTFEDYLPGYRIGWEARVV